MKDDIANVDERLDVLINESALIKLENIIANLNGKEKWYQISYPSIIRYFYETRGKTSINEAVLRIACVSSWIPAILKSDFHEESIKKIAYFENLYSNCNLWEIGSESYLGGMHQKGLGKYHGSRIFPIQSDNCPYLLKDYLEPIANILNSSDRWENTISTTSKYLHFMLPDLFPIFDKNVCKILFDSEINNEIKYSRYIFALQDVLNRKTFVLNYAKDHNISPLKVIDNILFHVEIRFNDTIHA
jgi:hypothetical protein